MCVGAVGVDTVVLHAGDCYNITILLTSLYITLFTSPTLISPPLPHQPMRHFALEMESWEGS